MFQVRYELSDGVTQEEFEPVLTFKRALEVAEEVHVILQSEMKEVNWIQIERVSE